MLLPFFELIFKDLGLITMATNHELRYKVHKINQGNFLVESGSMLDILHYTVHKIFKYKISGAYNPV